MVVCAEDKSKTKKVKKVEDSKDSKLIKFEKRGTVQYLRRYKEEKDKVSTTTDNIPHG